MKGELVLMGFLISSVVFAIITLIAKSVLRAGVSLLLFSASVAGVYFALGAEFLGIVQLIVYAGGIIVLYLFALMVVGEKTKDSGRFLFGLITAGILFLATVLSLKNLGKINAFNTSIEGVGKTLFLKYTATFEAVSVLLLVATIGALILVRRKE
jgi:NADH-quinone oxidoreductase subunit J